RLSDSGDELPSISAQRKMEPAKLARLVRGELDWIVMKALDKDRGRRYETANGFARDIQRYLADEPVEACPPSHGYKLRKFVRKHRTPLATAGAIFVSLASAASITSLQAIRATKERSRAEELQVQADQARAQAQEEASAALTEKKAAESQRDDA